MALTVNPAVSRSRRQWGVHAALFALGTGVGCLLAAGVALAIVSLLDQLLTSAVLAIIAASLIVWAVLHDLGLPLPLPYRQRQVPEWLRSALPAGAVAFLYGLMLGVGFLTLFTYSAQLSAFVAFPFLDTLWQVIAVAGLVSAGKTLVLLSAVGVTSPDEVVGRFRWSKTRIVMLRLATACVSLMMAVAILTAA
jgi:hypothetical protein